PELVGRAEVAPISGADTDERIGPHRPALGVGAARRRHAHHALHQRAAHRLHRRRHLLLRLLGSDRRILRATGDQERLDHLPHPALSLVSWLAAHSCLMAPPAAGLDTAAARALCASGAAMASCLVGPASRASAVWWFYLGGLCAGCAS